MKKERGKIETMINFVGVPLFIGGFLSLLGFNHLTDSQVGILLVVGFFVYIFVLGRKNYNQQKKEEKDYEDSIEKRLRAEQKIREKLDRESQAKSKK